MALCGLAPAASAFAQDAPTAPPAACTGPEHRQFDFWVGRWDVYRTGETILRAHSLIEKLYGGCVIREHWTPLRTATAGSLTGGGNLNHYDTVQRRWHQTWMDSSNARVVFEGGLVDGRMVITGFWSNANGPGKDGLVRMTYSRLDGGAVRQFGEISSDDGLSWSPFFDFTYRRNAAVK